MLTKTLSFYTLISFSLTSLLGPLCAASPSHFELVDTHLEQGGILYGFVDIDGDLERLATAATELLNSLRTTMPQLAQIPPVEIQTISQLLGLHEIKAIGLSSSIRENGFHNRTFVLTDGATKGILSLSNVENTAFQAVQMAPLGADVIYEQSVNTKALIEASSEIMSALFGPDSRALLQGYLQTPFANSSITVKQILELLDGRGWLIAQISDSETISAGTFGEFPKIDFMVRVETSTDLLATLSEMPELKDLAPDMSYTKVNDLSQLSGFLPENPYYAPVLIAKQSSNELFIASSMDYYQKCLDSNTPKLDQSEAYLSATTGLPNRGNSLLYCSPDIKPLVERYVELSVQAAGPQGAMMRPYLGWSFESLSADYPMASVGRNELNGIFVASNWSVSHKRNLATMAYANPVTIGLLAAMAIPAFQKVRTTSQEKTITNNLRQLASAADQYFLENGQTSVQTQQLIGENAYIKYFNPVAGESYPEIIQMGEDIVATLPNGDIITVDF